MPFPLLHSHLWWWWLTIQGCRNQSGRGQGRFKLDHLTLSQPRRGRICRPITTCLPPTVAVWTQKNFFPLLTRPQGSQGCQKITFFFLQLKLFSFCAKIALKRHKLQKPSKLKKKCQKKPVFLDFITYSSIWGQS
jgi:hypothetical protein